MDAKKTRGQLDYEADVERRPTYHDGTPRKRWDELSDVARWSWEREHAAPTDIDDDGYRPQLGRRWWYD